MPFSKKIEDLVADFRGLPRTVSEASRNPPISLDNILEQIKEKYNLEKPSPERSIVENWNEIFGSLASRCSPLSLKEDKILVISVANQTLRSELQFRKQTIIKKIQKLPFCETISDILIRA